MSRPPSKEPLRRARLRPDRHREYPASYHWQWFRVVQGHDPDVPLPPGQMGIEMAGGVQRVPVAHFEVRERTRPLVLVVDDDQAIRRTLEIALGNAGYDVLLARDGEEATRHWQESGPNVIVADIHLPRKSGLLFMQELEAQGSATPIIAMTDGGPAGNLSLLGLAKLLGSVRTMAKPYKLEEMVEAVNEAVRR